MSVELNPEELGFKRPFNHEVTQILKITNTNAGPVAFKVKTTAPKQYCVRPNSGVIKPHDAVDVQVLLQAMKEDPPLDARCRDKFLVQSVQIDNADETNVASLWSAVEKTNKASILEKKIRVQFLPAESSSHVNGAPAADEPPAYSSPAPTNYGSPAPAPSSDRKSPLSDTKSTASNVAESTGLAGTASAIASAVPRSQEELKEQLAAAHARISVLTNQLADPQIRQRKVAEAQEKVQTIVQQSQNTGVPLHITAALCLVSFLIAYLFF